MLAQRVLGLAGLGADPPHLDLAVDAPQEFERAVRARAHEVAGLVETPAGRGLEGIGDESPRGEGRIAEVAPRDAHPADVELAGHARRHGAERPGRGPAPTRPAIGRPMGTAPSRGPSPPSPSTR